MKTGLMETGKETFKVRAYSFKELALMYFPGNLPASAVCQLRRWIRVGKLWEKLLDAGYSKGQKIFTPRQVRVIVEHVGAPESECLW